MTITGAAEDEILKLCPEPTRFAIGNVVELLYVIALPELDAVRVTVEPSRDTPLLMAISVPVPAVPVRLRAFVAVILPAAVMLVPVNDIDAVDVALEDDVIAPPLATVTFSPDANVPSVRALAPAL